MGGMRGGSQKLKTFVVVEYFPKKHELLFGHLFIFFLFILHKKNDFGFYFNQGGGRGGVVQTRPLKAKPVFRNNHDTCKRGKKKKSGSKFTDGGRGGGSQKLGTFVVVEYSPKKYELLFGNLFNFFYLFSTK